MQAATYDIKYYNEVSETLFSLVKWKLSTESEQV